MYRQEMSQVPELSEENIISDNVTVNNDHKDKILEIKEYKNTTN
jgi:hypothetical protein